MADLTEVKSSRKVQSNIEKFESLSLKDESKQLNKPKRNQSTLASLENIVGTKSAPLLTATSTTSTPKVDIVTKRPQQTGQTTPASRPDSAIFVQKEYLEKKSDATLIEDAREILRHQPSLENIDAVLAYLKCGINGHVDFNIKRTSPQAAMVVRVMATHTIADIWPSLNEEDLSKTAARVKHTLLEIMFSVTGIEALLAYIHVRLKISQPTNIVTMTMLDFMTDLLEGPRVVLRLLHDATDLYEQGVQRQLFWQSVVTLLGGSKILSSTTATKTNSDRHATLLNGTLYTKWLATNIVTAAIELPPIDTQHWANLTELFRRGLSLGYRDIFVTHIYTSLLLGSHALWAPLHSLMRDLHSHDQKLILDCILNDLSQTYLRRAENEKNSPNLAKVIAGAAALINGIVSHNQYLLGCLLDWVSTSSINQASRGPGIRRAVIALLAGSNANLERILERSLTSFGNKSFIQNAPMSQQEHLAQIIFLVIGYLHRQQPQSLTQMPIPSLVMNATSNRLASSIPKPRLLGMIIAVGMSQCVDEPGKVMDFGVEEMETEDAKAMLALIRTHDRIGDIKELQNTQHPLQSSQPATKKRKITSPRTENSSRPAQTSKIIAIEELPSSSDDEDDLIPYQKPIDDPEDSDEDPTLINRDKPNAPIYIIDLIKQLQSPSDKLDIISLALKTAPNLIRRKAGFGTELSDNVHGLVTALINLQDGMSKPEHQQQRLDALIACMITQPKEVGKLLTNTYFNGDYSLSQRVTILTALGLGAREIAGFNDGKTSPPDTPDFPSQRLPSHLQANPTLSLQSYSSTSPSSPKKIEPMPNAISALANIATADTIRPLAEAAVESHSGPSMLKVTRTSARLTKARQQQTATAASRTRCIPKDAYSIIVDSVYLRLISPLSAILAYAAIHPTSSTSASPLLHPSTLSLHVQTLTLVLHTLGPAGLSPPATYYSVTHETLLLLTHLSRTRAALDGTVLPALLALLLALIDMTVEIGVVAMERLIGAEFGVQVAALVRWTAGLQDKNDVPPPSSSSSSSGAMEDGDASGNTPWTVLAAGVQVRWAEIGKRFQNRMFGLEGDDGF